MAKRRIGVGLWAMGATTALLLGISAPAQATAETEGQEQSLVVTPTERLFDVTLRPGESADAVATLQNRSAAALRIGVRPVLTGWVGHDRGLESLHLSGSRAGTCDAAASALAPGVRMSEAQSLDLGTLAPGEVAEWCFRVAYPASGSAAQDAISFVDLSFTGIERSPDTDELSVTGAAPRAQVWLMLAGAGLLLVGLATAAGRRRRQRI